MNGATVYGNPVGPNMMFCVNAATDSVDAVAAILNYVNTDTEGVTLMELQRGVPSNKTAYNILVAANMIDDVTKTAMKIIDDTDTGLYSHIDPNEILDAMEDTIQVVGFGEKTPAAAAADFMEKGNRILQGYK